MRTIKFRSWDVENKKMLKPHEFNYAFLQNADFTHFIPMQFTGLLDKFGKEIYEGDILRYETTIGLSGPEHNWHGPLVVEWQSYGWQPFWGQRPERCEIIGNIYENKELLK